MGTFSFEKVKELLQDAIDLKYPPIATPGSSYYYGTPCRFMLFRTFDTEAIFQKTCSAPESDPDYGIISYTIDEGSEQAVLDGELQPASLKIVSDDGTRTFDADEADLSQDNNLNEAGKRNSSGDSTKINQIMRMLMDLINSEDLEKATSSKMMAMTPTDPTNAGATEAWDGSKSKYSIDQLISAVPRAIATWAKGKAGDGNQPTKADLHLPYKNPDGTVNPDGITAALQRIGQVKGVPSDVIAAARKELESAAKKHQGNKESISEKEIVVEDDLLKEWSSLEGEIFEENFTLDFSEATFDEATGVAKNVQMLASVSKNNRRYPAEVQQEAIPLFEGAKSYLNHQPHSQMREARRVEDYIGHYSNVKVSGEGKMTGDFNLILGKKAVTEEVLPILRNKEAAKKIGNSIVAHGQMVKGDDGVYEVKKISGVRSVDLVTEPATTSGVFSENLKESLDTEEDDMATDLKGLTLEQLKESRPDLFKALEAQKSHEDEVKTLTERIEALEKKLVETEAKLVESEKKTIEAEEREKARLHTEKVEKAIREANVPDKFRYEEDKKTIKPHIFSTVERCVTDEEIKSVTEGWEKSFEGFKEQVKEEKKQVAKEKVIDLEESKKEIDDKALISLHRALAA